VAELAVVWFSEQLVCRGANFDTEKITGFAVPANPNRQHRTSTEFPNFRIYGSCGGIDFVVPSVDDGVAVGIVDELDVARISP
jgi:hypothetical protein